MKKIFLLIAIAVLCFSGLSANADNLEEYIILVYMNGSNLESDRGQATKAINKMIKVSGDEKFPGIFIVETGGTKNWQLEELKNTKNQRFLIKNGKIQEMTTLKTRSMGDSDNFKEFLIFGINKPAKHYMLIFWNHGEGSLKGFGFDELNKNDTLTLLEMNTAFKNANIKQKFDLIGFDTCLMSAIETAQLLSNYSDYMLASQETEKQGGWNYNIFKNLSQKDISTEKFAKSIMDEYITGENYYSITLWNLKNINKLTDVINSALSRWDDRLNILSQKVLSLRKEMLDFGGNIKQKELNYTYPEMVDLDEVMNAFIGKNQNINNSYSSAKQSVIVYHLSNGYNKIPSGINIFLPYGNDFTKKDLELYKTTGFLTSYIKFIENYYQLLNDNNKFKITNAPKLIDDRCILDLEQEKDDYLAYISLFKSLGERKYLSLGYMGQTKSQNGKIYLNKPENWIYAINQPLYVIQTSKTSYVTPMLLKHDGREMFINIEFSYDGKSFKINKISEINDKITNSKDIGKLQRGDEIAPLYPIYKFNDINKKFVSNLKPVSYQKGTAKRILIENNINLKIQPLNNNYQLRIMLENLHGEQIYSLPCN